MTEDKKTVLVEMGETLQKILELNRPPSLELTLGMMEAIGVSIVRTMGKGYQSIIFEESGMDTLRLDMSHFKKLYDDYFLLLASSEKIIEEQRPCMVSTARPFSQKNGLKTPFGKSEIRDSINFYPSPHDKISYFIIV